MAVRTRRRRLPIPILIGIAIRLVGGSSPGRGPAFLDQITNNGLFVGLAAVAVAIVTLALAVIIAGVLR